MNSEKDPPFLTAEWRNLLMLNYTVDPDLIRHLVPPGTELDFRNRRTYLSLVGFMFLNTKVMGLSVPFHKNFEEVNLRFYVRRKVDGAWRRGVVFVREIVPRWAIAFVAKTMYKENYEALPMDHRVSAAGESLRPESSLSYSWKKRNKWNCIRATITGEPHSIRPDTEEAFIMEHYWGYSSGRGGGCIEYPVEHPSWRIWDVSEYSLECDIANVYGEQFVEVFAADPVSGFVAEGSPITVGKGSKLQTSRLNSLVHS